MESKGEAHSCLRCGTCCHLDVAAYASLDDIRRWEEEGRQDILDHIREAGVTWTDDAVVSRYESNVRTCLMSCVYLRWQGALASCAIYGTRTKICRSFVPGSTDLCPQHRHAPRSKSGQ
jgi:Fe-S-cluster containining protein